MKTILLATDGSPSAQKATETAIELAEGLGAVLRIVSAWRIPVYEYGYVPAQYTPELIDAQRQGAERAVAHAVDAATTAGITATFELRQGDASNEICAAADEVHADMIVLGAHGWGAMKRLLFGSVSSAVLHHASCPVLVVRGDAEAQEREKAGAGTALSVV